MKITAQFHGILADWVGTLSASKPGAFKQYHWEKFQGQTQVLG